MKHSSLLNQIKKGLQITLILAVLFLNFGASGIRTVYAVDCSIQKTLTLRTSSGGTISASPLPNCGSNYSAGTVVLLTASPSGGFSFIEWRDGTNNTFISTSNPINVTMNVNQKLTAVFFIPSNDDFASAKPINNISYVDSIDTIGATQDVTDPDNVGPCDGKQLNKGNNTVWYKYTPSVQEFLSVDTLGSTYSPGVDLDTYVSVWTGTEGSLSLVTCDDDTSAGLTSQLSFMAAALTPYYIEVASWNGGFGGTALGTQMGGNLKFHVGHVSQTDVYIGGGTPKGSYDVLPGVSMVEKYAVDGGPVVISSTNGVKMTASLNQWRRRPGGTAWTGVAQSMALPFNQISNKYVMPRYDYTDSTNLYDAVLLANVDSVSRDITVTIGTTVMGTYTLAPSESQYKTYLGVAGGPVVASSAVGAKIIASIYELRRDPAFNGWMGQSEMMGRPWEQLSDTYVIPIYFGAANPNTLDARLFIANADTVARDITVTIAGTPMGTYTLQPSTGQVLKYLVDGGPVVISSAAGAKIIASLNQWRRRPGGTAWTGVTQSMALPFNQISNQYAMPRYDYSDSTNLYDAVLLANVDSVSRDITVTIGETVMGTYTVGASQSQYKTYLGVAGGAVVVSSAVGAKIIASMYELRRDPLYTGWTDQSEMMGLPWEQLSDTYIIPIYFGAANPNTLDARLFFSVP